MGVTVDEVVDPLVIGPDDQSDRGQRYVGDESQQGCIAFELPTGETPREFQFTLDSGFANQTGEWSLAGADTASGSNGPTSNPANPSWVQSRSAADPGINLTSSGNPQVRGWWRSSTRGTSTRATAPRRLVATRNLASFKAHGDGPTAGRVAVQPGRELAHGNRDSVQQPQLPVAKVVGPDLFRSMRTQRPAVRVLFTLAGLAAVAALGVFVVRGRHHTHAVALTATAPRRPRGPASRPTAAPRPPLRPPITNRWPNALNPTTGVGAARPGGAKVRHAEPQATLDRTLGQLMVAKFAGDRPSRTFLQRIRLGQIGGVILFADNLVGGPTLIRAVTQDLQVAASQGGNPPLLVMTDQEGGAVRRIPGPPLLAPTEMGSAATAFQQGQAAGSLLRSVGINVDLAPVADVDADANSFLGTRAFGSSPALVADRACAFAAGLAKEGVGYTLKHFPGLGMATSSTDASPVSIEAPAAALRADYLAYAKCAKSPLAMVMVSSGIYPSLTGPLPAVMSPLTYQRELRIAAPQVNVPTISDDLQAPALADQPTPARTAINAGLDMAMYAQTEDASAEAYQLLEQDVADGQITPERLREAAQAALRLKQAIAGA